KTVSAKTRRQYIVCPVAIDGATVTLATADPTNPLVLDDFRQSLGLQVTLCVATPSAILEAIERTYGTGASRPLQKIVDTIGRAEADGERPEDVGFLRDLASEAPVVRLVNLLLEEAVKEIGRASCSA